MRRSIDSGLICATADRSTMRRGPCELSTNSLISRRKDLRDAWSQGSGNRFTVTAGVFVMCRLPLFSRYARHPKSQPPGLGFRKIQLGYGNEFRRPMDASGLRAHPRSEAGAAKVHGYTSSQMFQSCSVDDRFTKVEAGSNISVRLDA